MAGNNGGNLNIDDIGSNIGLSPYGDDVGTMSMSVGGGKAPIDYLKFILSDAVFDMFGDFVVNNAFEEAFIEISDLILDDIILDNLYERYSITANSTYNDGAFTKTHKKRILKVVRQNTTAEDTVNDNQYYYNCRKVFNYDGQAVNPNSLYFENDPFNPAWYVNSSGGINILPKNSSSEPTGKIYYMSFPKFGVGVNIDSYQTHNLDEASGLQNFVLIGASDEKELFYGIPDDCRKAVYVSMALNLVEGYLSDFIHDDEDLELVELLTKQSNTLVGIKAILINNVRSKYGIPAERSQN
tara:strand:+ start:3575 stop:4468 length:894 start_codon:yes stop_codon:yes gene_type:complete